MVIDTSQKFLSAASSYMIMTLGSRSQTKNFYVSFCTEDFRSLLGYLQMNILETWYDERYCFKVLSGTSAPITMILGSRSQT